jgi:hypothetical protein
MADGLRISIADQGDASLVNELGNSIKEALAEQGKGKWLGTSAGWIGNKAVAAIDGAIGGIDLLQVFGAAWTTAHTLRERADPDKYPWDTPQYVKLGEHTVNFDVKPKLVVSVAGWESKPIELAMGLSAMINAVELKIKAGHIESLCGGSCDLGVEIKLGGQAIMKRKTLKTLKLDMEHRFREPGLSLTSRQPAPAT